MTDFGGVLTTRSPTAKGDFERRVGVTMADYRDATKRAAAKLDVDPLEEVESGRMPEADFRAILEAELPDAAIDEFGDAYYAQHLPNPTMIECVAGAKARGVRTALMTNAALEWSRYWQPKVPSIDEVFDVIVVSASVGARKPHEDMFLAALERLGGIAPEGCLFVDDSEANCETARRLGMHAIKFTDTDSAVREVTAMLADGAGARSG